MKIKYISGILAALLFPLVVFGQSETYYSQDCTDSIQIKVMNFPLSIIKMELVFCSNMNRSLFMNYLTPEDKGLLKINLCRYCFRKGETLLKKSEDQI